MGVQLRGQVHSDTVLIVLHMTSGYAGVRELHHERASAVHHLTSEPCCCFTSGVYAYDDINGDISACASTSDLPLDTTVATQLGSPVPITYGVSDAAGNMAVPVSRHTVCTWHRFCLQMTYKQLLEGNKGRVRPPVCMFHSCARRLACCSVAGAAAATALAQPFAIMRGVWLPDATIIRPSDHISL